ncbi:MAG TPA: hypothetical protein VGE02_03590 [Gemmatimonadales bacterium]
MDLRICNAIAERRLLMVGYKGVLRVVEPHLHGRTTTGNDALSAWMRPGWSRVDPEGGWRLFHTDALHDMQVLPESFDAPRPDFNPADAHFAEVHCHVTPPASG